jgi:hypothetical protein
MFGQEEARGALLVVIGAGASFDSAPLHTVASYSSPWRPPLADHLFQRPAFQEIMAGYRHMKAVIPFLSNVPEGSTLEQLLDRLRGESEHRPMRRSQIAAVRYYLRELIETCTRRWLDETGGITNYHTLLDELQAWHERTNQPVSIVSFNYDLLLEDALPTVGVKPDSLDAYVSHDDWKIIKPHGSVNWWREIETPLTNPGSRDEVIERAAEGLQISQRYTISKQPFLAGAFPAIAIPVEATKDFECPDMHLKVLVDCFRRTGQVLIVGWRATEKNFLELWAKNFPQQMKFRLVIACQDALTARRTHLNLANSGIGQYAKAYYHPGGFSDFMAKKGTGHLLGG